MVKKAYVYAIYVDGVVRYIGKGTGERIHFHMTEVERINKRYAAGANTDATSTKFYRKLAEAARRGATITGRILVHELTEPESYQIEKEKIEMIYNKDPGQLWNTIDERLIGTTWEAFKASRQRLSGRVLAERAGSKRRRPNSTNGR